MSIDILKTYSCLHNFNRDWRETIGFILSDHLTVFDRIVKMYPLESH